MKKKKIFSMVISFLFALTLFPLASLAADHPVGTSTYNLSDYTFSHGDTVTIPDNMTVTINGDSSTTYYELSIVCGTNVDLTINNLNIYNSASYGILCPIVFTGGNNTLKLWGANNITASNLGPGIKVQSGT